MLSDLARVPVKDGWLVMRSADVTDWFAATRTVSRHGQQEATSGLGALRTESVEVAADNSTSGRVEQCNEHACDNGSA